MTEPTELQYLLSIIEKCDKEILTYEKQISDLEAEIEITVELRSSLQDRLKRINK